MGTLINQAGVDAVILEGDAFFLSKLGLGTGGRFAHEAIDKIFDHAVAKSSNMGHPFCVANARKALSGLVATGKLTAPSSGASLMESL